MKLLKTTVLAAVAAIGLGGVAGLDAANADTRCHAVAIRANGASIPPTRASEVRRYERRACNAAIRRCERRLDRLRYTRGRPMPYARCEVVRVSDLRPRRHWRDGYRGGFRCNYRACDAAYRSFRPSDCTFQPYNGPRRLCTK